MPADSHLPVPRPYPIQTQTEFLPHPPRMPAGGDEQQGVPWGRYIAALLRYKWLILGLTILGVTSGVIGTRFIVPEYRSTATIWISDAGAGDRGPIRAEGILSGRAWPELVRSFAILDKVAIRERLFLELENPADSSLFANFGLADRIRPGEYELRSAAPGRYELLTSDRAVADSGAAGDSIGTRLGFLWTLPADSAAVRSARFRVKTIRTASNDLRDHVGVTASDRTNLIGVSLGGSDPELLGRTLNAVLDEFVATAADLKKRTLVENSAILGEQLQYAYGELRSAEVEYETFRVNTITLPSEGTAVAAGIEVTRDPVFSSFFEQRVEFDRTERDVQSLERFLQGAASSTADLNVLWGIPAVATYGQELRAALSDYTTKEAALRSLRAVYTAEHPTVRDAQRVLDGVRSEVILPLVQSLTVHLRERQRDLSERLAGTSRELRQIPQRTIEEMRLARNVAVRENLYTMLKNRFESARLAEASSLPDVSILDRAGTPQAPSSNTAPRIILMGTVAGFVLGVLIAFLLDRIDPRVRYPEQVTREMGLGILGAVPALPRGKGAVLDVQNAFQVVEAFRSIRLSLFHATGGHHPIQFAVSSPGVGDGKSLVSANLALAFAEIGYSTVLVDGDIRRGSLHSMFGVQRRPGLLDHLAGDAPLDAVLRPTSHSNLTLLPGGTRSQRGPELLMGPNLARLMQTLRSRYHVIVIDTPPLGASIDPFVLGSAVENLVLVMRSGETDRKMAHAKLEILDRLPIRVVGVVLNDIRATGVYKYYSYFDGYAMDEDGDATAAGHGGATQTRSGTALL